MKDKGAFEGQISQKNLCHFVRKNLKKILISLKKSQKFQKSKKKLKNLKNPDKEI